MIRKALIILIIALFSFPALATSTLKIGSPPPTFTLLNLKGETVSLDPDLGNNVIILSFFASWSKSCQQEIFFLNDLNQKYKNRKIEIFGISFDRKLEELKSFVNENHVQFEILPDRKLKTLKDYRILIIPTLFVIDQEGDIRSIYIDFDENVEEALAQEIQKLLEPKKK